MIGGGMSSRLFQNIREKYGFAYTVYSFYDPMADGGVFALYMACAPRYEEKSVELLFHEIGEVRQGNSQPKNWPRPSHKSKVPSC
jgi:predicted Zn-dependent peptidase